jgi:hypothetical protein
MGEVKKTKAGGKKSPTDFELDTKIPDNLLISSIKVYF